MRPFTFGSRKQPLYGVYHPAHGAGATPRGVVVCYPLGVEYMQIHRAFRQLGEELARAGFHVLRFDYSGTGDSWGDGENASVSRWLEDLEFAITELKDMSQAAKVSLAGFRFGGSLALLGAAGRDDIESIVLWEPIHRGASYAESLRSDSIAGNAEGASRPWIVSRGFRISSRLLDDLDELDLSNPGGIPGARLHVISAHATAETLGLVSRLRQSGAEASLHETGSEGGWSADGGFSSTILDRSVLQSIVQLLEGHDP